MKYFIHDTSSFDDEKITKLFLEFGYEGLGLFYTALEKIGRQEKPIDTSVLKAQLKVGKRLDKCWKFMEQIDLIQSKNGETFNEQLLNFSEKYQIKKEKNREKISQWRDKQKDTENVTGTVPVRNPPKVKLSKVKLSKVIKNKYAEFVFLTDEEYQKLISEHGNYWTKKMIETLDNYKGSTGKTYKSDYRAILSWVEEKIKTSPEYLRPGPKKKQSSDVDRILTENYDDPKYKRGETKGISDLIKVTPEGHITKN